jgi:DNA helicase II / ATP-dependent DNA helicase PcrA
MFRTSRPELARDLAIFIREIFRGGGFKLTSGELIRVGKNGNIGDCALLCPRPGELDAGDNPRLPLLLRQELQAEEPRLEVFNPRGEDLTTVPIIERFGGLLLECIDPDATNGNLPPTVVQMFATWRQRAVDFANSKDVPPGLVDYAIGWIERNPNRSGYTWPRRVSVLELVYGLAHYFPELHNEPEGQLYLEMFTRQLAVCEQIGKFKATIVRDPADPGLEAASIKELLRDFIVPIASGTVGINEELVDAFPRGRLPVLSIHQSKGLEFPLTIVDVGSEFQKNSAAQAFKRYPSGPAMPHVLEDSMRPFSELGVPARSGRDRAFDDLERLFFVAFSRPQNVLLLVGLTAALPGGIANLGTGWRRDGICPWVAQRPFELI